MADKPPFEGNQYSFLGKMDSSVDPMYLRDDQYYAAMNCVSRGGTIQTRPGMATIFNLPCGNLQGFTMFTPTESKANMVFVVGGTVYRSEYPFFEYEKINGLSFYKRSKFISFATCLQTTDYTDNGELFTLQKPKKILVMQDRNTRAAFWDGGTARHLNPTPSVNTNPETGEIVTQPNRDETPIGLWMAWAGNRLWVSRGNDVFASDYGNPLKFTESQYIAEGRKFSMPEDVTGMIQPSSGLPLLVFGESSITFLQANILDRTEWLNTADFQRTEYGVGCIAPRSIINKLGLVWFYSPNGWTNLNYALQTFNDSRSRYLDKEMTFSKNNISVDKTVICAGEIEDYLFISVPSGDKYPRHTWVYDQFERQPGWDGIWTGTRPIQWAKTNIDGTERVFFASKDSGGVNRVWEAMQPSHEDNGQPITSWVRGRDHASGDRLWKRFSHADMFLERAFGTVDIGGWWGGTRGAPRKILNHRMIASDAPIVYTPATAYSDSNIPNSLIPQTRYLKTEEYDESSQTECERCSVESDDIAAIDTKFYLFLCWSGRLGVEGYRVYAEYLNENSFTGECNTDESGIKALSQQGCSSTTTEVITTEALGEFTSTQTQTASCPASLFGDSKEATVTKTSIISQQDAVKKATGAALLEALGLVQCFNGGNLIDEDSDTFVDESGNNLVWRGE